MGTAKEKAMLILFKAAENEISLHQVYYRKIFVKFGSSGKYVEAKTLPPTSDVCKYHPLQSTSKHNRRKKLSVDWILWIFDGLCDKKNYELCIQIDHRHHLSFSQYFTLIARVNIRRCNVLAKSKA